MAVLWEVCTSRRTPRGRMCGDKPSVTALIDSEQFCGMRGQEAPAPAAADGDITVEELKSLIESNQAPFVLDVRNPEEFQICRIPGSTLLPLPELPQRHGELDKARAMIVHCQSGMAS